MFLFCQNMSERKSSFSTTFLLIVGGPIFALGVGYFLIQGLVFQPADQTGESVVFEVASGERGVAIAQRLEDEGLVKSAYAFFAYNVALGRYQQMKAGRYLLSPAMTAAEISEAIFYGESLPEIAITFPEGLNLRQWQERMVEYFPEIDLTSYRVGDFQEEFSFLADASPEATLEGYLYPDTYYFNRQANHKDLVRRFLSNFERRLGDLIEEFEREGGNIHELVIKASLVEKEVSKMEDKKKVAGLIERRLRLGMPLQMCATITYLTGRASTQVSRAETEIDSPYNTYRYPGLPHGPICHPGRESFEAVLNYQLSEYLYYLSTPEGETIFSRTLDEHNRAKNNHLR